MILQSHDFEDTNANAKVERVGVCAITGGLCYSLYAISDCQRIDAIAP